MFEHVQTVELYVAQIGGYSASLTLERQQEYNHRVQAEEHVSSLANRAILSLTNIIRICRRALELPDGSLWQLEGIIERVVAVPDLATRENLEFASRMSVTGKAYRALRLYDRRRREFHQVNSQLFGRVREDWENHFNDYLEPRTAPDLTPWDDVVPFDDDQFDRIMSR